MHHNRKQRLLLIPFGSMGMVLATASLALACTAIAGTTTITEIGTTTGLQCDGQGKDSNSPTYDDYVSQDGSEPETACETSPGQTITAIGTNAQVTDGNGNPVYYNLHFLNHEDDQDSMDVCMGKFDLLTASYADEKIGGTTAVESDGDIPATTGTIPADAETTQNVDGSQKSTGPALVCFISSSASGNSNFNYATKPAEVAVL